MVDFLWRNRYEIGIPLIDVQHKNIFRLLSELNESVHEEDRDRVERLFQDILRNVGEHFRTEEVFMSQMGFPGLEDHAREHIKALEDLQDLHSRFKDGTTSLAMLVGTYLGGWLRHHISEGDQAYATFLRVQNERGAT
ncbi:MAG: hemerythrin family protein [Desulfovibrio sp.]|nr:hemerythrin family protein [Desulfovibrio sp.]